MTSFESERILALDLGEKRVGVAVSDPLRITAQPCPTLDRQPQAEFLKSLEQLMTEYEVRKVVVGLPIGLAGQRSSPSYQSVQNLLPILKKQFPTVEWIPWDERLTTTSAIKVLSSAPKKVRQRKELRDQIAAQLILDSYLRSTM